MPGTGVKEKYNVGINSKGYILRGAPNVPSYHKSVIPTEIERLAISDIAYSDFSGSGLFYVAQTDWSAGIKNETTWRDDAKFYYSTNIDAYSEKGLIKLEKEVELKSAFSKYSQPVDVYCGVATDVSGSIGVYFGSADDISGNVKVWKKIADKSWEDISLTNFNTSQNSCSQLIGHKSFLWALTKGSGSTNVVQTYDTSAWADKSAAASASISATFRSAICGTELASSLYLAVDDSSAKRVNIISTADGGATFANELTIATNSRIIDMIGYVDKIYYLLYNNTDSYIDLRIYDPSNSTDISLQEFFGVTANVDGLGNKLLKEYKGKLVITIPSDRILEYDGTTLLEIFTQDETKDGIGVEAEAYLNYGTTEKGNRLYWGNLIYDGEAFYNHKKDLTESLTERLVPLFTDDDDEINYFYTDDANGVYRNTASSAVYKDTLSANFLVINEMSQISSIDKLLISATLIFDELSAGDKAEVYYSLDNRQTWVSVGDLDYANSADQGITKKEFFITDNIVFNKIWWRINLAGTATTPKIRDFIMSYKPWPDFKNKWTMRLNTSDNFKLLNRQTEERDGNEINAELWNLKVLKQKVTLEDVDYVECSLTSAMASGATSAFVTRPKRFPRQGRIRAVTVSGVVEEMYYTSAETDSILGIIRGARGTRAGSYSSGQILKNDYDIFVENVRTDLTFTDENKTESTTEVLLIEA